MLTFTNHHLHRLYFSRNQNDEKKFWPAEISPYFYNKITRVVKFSINTSCVERNLRWTLSHEIWFWFSFYATFCLISLSTKFWGHFHEHIDYLDCKNIQWLSLVVREILIHASSNKFIIKAQHLSWIPHKYCDILEAGWNIQSRANIPLTYDVKILFYVSWWCPNWVN